MKLGLTLAAVGLLAVSAIAAPKSGLEPGQGPIPFDVVDVTGPDKGKQLCLV